MKTKPPRKNYDPLIMKFLSVCIFLTLITLAIEVQASPPINLPLTSSCSYSMNETHYILPNCQALPKIFKKSSSINSTIINGYKKLDK